jgi:YebC/PmpR family DNA-binding regulatory protein
MSGHSKWATIRRAKESKDAKRGAVFTKIANLITIAAREKGGDLDSNFSLRMAIDKAKQVNMPKDNIERAIKRGTGELGGEQIEELVYEGIGPANSQFVVKCLTDNKNRSASAVRHIFSKHSGSLSPVMWNFSQKGVVRILNEEFKIKNLSFDDVELELIDAGADDIQKEEEGMTIYTKIEDLQSVKKYLDEKEIKVESAEIEYIPNDEIELSDDDRDKVQKLIDELEENEDVSDYYMNVSI